MEKVIKSNIEARAASLIEGAQRVTLFSQDSIQCNGIYLAPHQEYKKAVNLQEQIVLSVFNGMGELRFQEKTNPPVTIYVERGDIISLPSTINYVILNTGPTQFTCTELIVATK